MTRLLRYCRLSTALTVPALLALSACDNVGRAFDPDGGGGGGKATEIYAIAAGGYTVEGRPKVTDVFPKGNGWPGTVPIVVVFNETIAAESIAPSTGTPNLFIRAAGTGDPNNGGLGGGGNGGGAQSLGASYDFFLGGRVVVIRPTVPFDTTEANSYEIVITPEVRDVDGIRFGGSEERILGTFTADKSDTITEGEILTVLPLDNARDSVRDASVVAIFTKPAMVNSVNTGSGADNFFVRPSGGAALIGDTSFPLRIGGSGGNADGRVVEFVPQTRLAGGVEFEIVVDDTIAFADSGKLNFRGRSPFARFRTVPVGAANSVVVGNATSGAPDKVNRNNLDSLQLDVELPDDAVVGDVVVARIYGLDKNGGTTQALSFVEATATAPASGTQTLSISFAGKLGTLVLPAFLEGPLQFAVNVIRSNRPAGFILSTTTNDPAFDLTPPELTTPVVGTSGNRLFYTDQEQMVFFGTGGEDLSSASLVLDATPAPAPGATSGTIFGVGSGGRFMFEPIQLGRRSSPLGFSLTLTDAAGNESSPFVGTVVQRGQVTGSVSSGSLVVEAFDDATMAAVAGVTVWIEPGLPTSPATGRLTGVTGADGRVMFTGLAAATYSITLIRDGYDMISLLDSGAGFVSLPLRPGTNATGTVRGTAAFTAGTGQSARIGCNILDDVTAETISTTTAAPTAIPATPARPNRPYILTAFGGTFEPTAKPTFTSFACSICGPTGQVREAALAPIVPGGTGIQALALLPSVTSTRGLASSYTLDLSTWTGLDTGDLAGTPTVRVMASLFGLAQMTAVGVGFAAPVGSTATYTIDGTYSLGSLPILEKLLPKFWVSTQAEDSSGAIARHRRVILNPVQGTTFASGAVPAIGTITPPVGVSVGAPAVTFEDRLDPTVIPNGLGLHVISVMSGSRRWRVLRQDLTGAVGPVTLQLPVGPGLLAGSWRIHTESSLLFSLSMGADDFVLEEFRREEVTFGRTGETVFTVQ